MGNPPIAGNVLMAAFYPNKQSIWHQIYYLWIQSNVQRLWKLFNIHILQKNSLDQKNQTGMTFLGSVLTIDSLRWMENGMNSSRNNVNERKKHNNNKNRDNPLQNLNKTQTF